MLCYIVGKHNSHHLFCFLLQLEHPLPVLCDICCTYEPNDPQSTKGWWTLEGLKRGEDRWQTSGRSFHGVAACPTKRKNKEQMGHTIPYHHKQIIVWGWCGFMRGWNCSQWLKTTWGPSLPDFVQSYTFYFAFPSNHLFQISGPSMQITNSETWTWQTVLIMVYSSELQN